MSKENTELTAFEAAGLPAGLDLGKALTQAASENPYRSSDPYLTFKRGAWTYWADGDHVPVEEGSQWVMHAGSIQRGFICWGPMGSGKLLGELMVPLGQDAIVEGALPTHEYACPETRDKAGNVVDPGGRRIMPWSPQRAAIFKCISGDDSGHQVMFKTNSAGGVNAFNDFVSKISEHYFTNSDQPHPIVTLGSSTYESKEYGTQYKPEFNIVGWTDLTAEMPEPVAEAKPKKSAAKKKSDAPARRQRRSA